MAKDTWKRGQKSRSTLQAAHSTMNLRGICADKENRPPEPSPQELSLMHDLSVMQSQLQRSESLLTEARRQRDNTRRRDNRRKAKEEKVWEKLKEMEASWDEMKVAQREMEGEIKKREEEIAKTISHLQNSNEHLRKQNKALQMKASRASAAKSAAKLKSAEVIDALTITSKHRLKEDGVVTDDARILVRDLVECNIPVKHVGKAINVVAQHFGIKVTDKISERTVGRVVLEGGIAAEMQIVDEANHSQSKLIDLINKLRKAYIFQT